MNPLPGRRRAFAHLAARVLPRPKLRVNLRAATERWLQLPARLAGAAQELIR